MNRSQNKNVILSDLMMKNIISSILLGTHFVQLYGQKFHQMHPLGSIA